MNQDSEFTEADLAMMRERGGKEYSELTDTDLAMALVFGSPNSLNGKFALGKIGDGHWQTNKEESPKKILQRFNLANKLIVDAEAKGLDTNKREVMESIGKEVETKMNSFFQWR